MISSMRRLAVMGGLVAGLSSTAVFAAGTSLEVSFDDPVLACIAGTQTASVSFNYILTSTGAADAATVTAQIDGSGLVNLAPVKSGNIVDGGGWNIAGRSKTAEGTYTVTLANGVHTVEVCAYQGGETDANRKSDCTTQTVTVACNLAVQAACPISEVFGKLTSSAELCKNQTPVNVQFRGDFGPTATLAISGPNGYTFNPSVARSGESCVYTYDWKTNANTGGSNGGSGTYSFVVSGINALGNPSELTFSQELTCTLPKR
jgi:hypothetical protein